MAPLPGFSRAGRLDESEASPSVRRSARIRNKNLRVTESLVKVIRYTYQFVFKQL